MNKYAHLSLESRTDIEIMLTEKMSFKKIESAIGKDSTTISKEIRKNSITERKGSYRRAFNDCIHAVNLTCEKRFTCDSCFHRGRACKNCDKCISSCGDYVKYSCPKLQKPPYVCNGCETKNKSRLEKRFYKAKEANLNYKKILSESRSGLNITEEEIEHPDMIVSPLFIKRAVHQAHKPSSRR